MKITEQERKRISKLYNLKESYPGSYDVYGDVDEPDDSDRGDAERDMWIDKTFMECLDKIHNDIGYMIEKSEYVKLLDDYYEKNNEKDFSRMSSLNKKDDEKSRYGDESGGYEELPF